MSERFVICASIALCAALSAGGCADKKKDSASSAGDTEHKPGRDKPRPASELPHVKPNTKLVAYSLGHKVGLAAIVKSTGAPEKRISAELRQANLLAKLLGTSVPQLENRAPAPADNDGALRRYLHGASTQLIARDLSTKHGDGHAGLFRLAVEAQLIEHTYTADSKHNQPHAQALATAAKLAGLDAAAMQPLSKLLRGGAAKKEVVAALVDLRLHVQKHAHKP